MKTKWTKRVVGYGLFVVGWVGFSYLLPHDTFSWKFVQMVGVATCFSFGGGVLDFARIGIWPWDATESRS